jgi:hypothetical protein
MEYSLRVIELTVAMSLAKKFQASQHRGTVAAIRRKDESTRAQIVALIMGTELVAR